MKISWLKLIISILICQLAGIIGSFFTSTRDWYALLIKPDFNPPSWVFGPVWIILYFLMGLSLYWIWTNKARKKNYTYFGIQLVLNVVWSIIFFGLQNIFLASLDILALDVFVILTMKEFYKIDKKATYILVPYLFWILFASVLNFSIFILNR